MRFFCWNNKFSRNVASQQVQADSRFQCKDFRTNCPTYGNGFPGPCVFWVLKNGLPIYASPHLRDFWKRFFFLKTMPEFRFFFLNVFFFGMKKFAQRFFSKRVFFVAAGGLNGFDVVDQMVGLVSTYGAHSQWEGYLHAGAVGSKGDSFFFCENL